MLSLNGDIKNAPTKTIPYFNFEVPTELTGVDTGILDPRDTYADAAEWEEKAKDLAARFIKNFAKYEGNEAGKALVDRSFQLKTPGDSTGVDLSAPGFIISVIP